MQAPRMQSFGTFFFRNRPALTLLIHLLKQRRGESTVNIAVLACSKGAEVYSIAYAIRCAQINLSVKISALDIAEDVIEFAKAGVYSLRRPGGFTNGPNSVAVDTFVDQPSSIFERMSPQEMAALFDREDGRLRIKPEFRAGISWHLGDAADPNLVDRIGTQDIIIANQFLCHMCPKKAEACLRGLARLAKPGAFIFVSGVDLAVRTMVAMDLGWTPVTELICEIHDGDPSLRLGWPLEYWGLEPLNRRRKDWQIRYASVFQTPRF